MDLRVIPVVLHAARLREAPAFRSNAQPLLRASKRRVDYALERLTSDALELLDCSAKFESSSLTLSS